MRLQPFPTLSWEKATMEFRLSNFQVVGPGMVTILSTSLREKISSEKLYTSERYESERIRLSFSE
jgi:hypothetical protein